MREFDCSTLAWIVWVSVLERVCNRTSFSGFGGIGGGDDEGS